MLKWEQTLQSEAIHIKNITNIFEEIKLKLQKSYTENPLKFWDKNNEFAEIKLKDENCCINCNFMHSRPGNGSVFKKKKRERKSIMKTI